MKAPTGTMTDTAAEWRSAAATFTTDQIDELLGALQGGQWPSQQATGRTRCSTMQPANQPRPERARQCCRAGEIRAGIPGYGRPELGSIGGHQDSTATATTTTSTTTASSTALHRPRPTRRADQGSAAKAGGGCADWWPDSRYPDRRHRGDTRDARRRWRWCPMVGTHHTRERTRPMSVSLQTLVEIVFVVVVIHQVWINKLAARVRQREEWLGYRKPRELETGREKIRRRLLG